MPHLHTHIELVYVLDGTTRCVADDKEAVAEAGDIFIAFPNQIHHYHDIERPHHHILIFSADFCPDLSKSLRTMSAECPVIKRDTLPADTLSAFEELKECYLSDSPYAEAELKARLTILLCRILPLMDLKKQKTGYDGNILKKAVTYCYDNFHGELSLESAEAALGISRYYLSHLFREKLNIGFKEYVNSLRIRAACDMLKNTDKSITEIAYDSGFGTTRTFNRCFMEAKGMCPKEYRRSHNEKRAEK